ncbi:hypothetical protein GH714_039440 [Hevea brasiliensis]|uniref:CCHC-type domain-containing protein n=1 Tax=Hevea brasiliensis TaxID=3981 RepID=A0A6A6KH63_HEVBR|nr:hypothetical protein GH714_039440 [Hevea brasiliensis]
MSDDKTLTKIPHFDGHYDHWSELMENLLRAKGQSLNRFWIAGQQKVWDSLKKKFGGNLKVKKSLLNALRREFEVLEMKRDETITEYFARVMVVANKMRSNGEEMTDTKIVEKILRTLTDKFTYVCVSIEESKDIETMSVDELQSTLVVHEQKFRHVHREDEDQVLKIEGRSNSTSRGRGSYRGRGRGRGRAVFNKATVECYKCHDLGHFQYECPNSSKEANYAELEEEDELLLMAYVELHETSRSDAWFVDSGCSNHMCGNSKMFSSLDTDFTHSVKLGNNTRMKVTGKGVIKLFLQGVCYTVSDVYCVPELKNNLLSVGEGLSDEDETNMMAHLVISDPTDYEEAVKSKKWRMAMDDEIKSIEKNHTWKYASEVLQRFGMENYNPVSNPIVPGQKLSRDEGGESVDATQFKQMVGSLMYLTASRPDLMFVVSFISRFMANPTKLHFAAIKRVLSSVFGASQSTEGTVFINGTASIGATDHDFICATLDWWPPDKCDYGTCSWAELLFLICAVVIFGLNALKGRTIASDGSAVGAWDPSDAESLIRYSVNRGYRIHGWELGNELSGNGVGARVAADQYASDVTTLQNIVENIHAGFEDKPLVLAPGGFFDANWFTKFIEKTPKSLQVVTQHIYNLGPGVDDHLIDKILDPSYLDGGSQPFSSLQGILKVQGHRQLLGLERQEVLTTVAIILSQMHLCSVSGMASSYDTKTYCRQTLIGGNYGLLNTTTFVPNPDYYSALLWHRLMGQNALSTSFSGTKKIRAYAHCSKATQGITLLLINLDGNTTVQVSISTENVARNGTWILQEYQNRRAKFATITRGSKLDENTREEYHLTAKDGDLHSQSVLLNGKILTVNSSGAIPPLDPIRVGLSNPITVAPFSIVFAQITNITVPACV